jgi:hypothetical protein
MIINRNSISYITSSDFFGQKSEESLPAVPVINLISEETHRQLETPDSEILGKNEGHFLIPFGYPNRTSYGSCISDSSKTASLPNEQPSFKPSAFTALNSSLKCVSSPTSRTQQNIPPPAQSVTVPRSQKPSFHFNFSEDMPSPITPPRRNPPSIPRSSTFSLEVGRPDTLSPLITSPSIQEENENSYREFWMRNAAKRKTENEIESAYKKQKSSLRDSKYQWNPNVYLYKTSAGIEFYKPVPCPPRLLRDFYQSLKTVMKNAVFGQNEVNKFLQIEISKGIDVDQCLFALEPIAVYLEATNPGLCKILMEKVNIRMTKIVNDAKNINLEDCSEEDKVLLDMAERVKQHWLHADMTFGYADILEKYIPDNPIWQNTDKLARIKSNCINKNPREILDRYIFIKEGAARFGTNRCK